MSADLELSASVKHAVNLIILSVTYHSVFREILLFPLYHVFTIKNECLNAMKFMCQTGVKIRDGYSFEVQE